MVLIFKPKIMLKQIITNCLILLCFYSCIEQSKEKVFLSKNEFEDFSQFNNVSVFIRGGDSEKNPIIMIDAPRLVNDISKVGLYVVTLDKKDYRIINAKWTLTEDSVNADTVKLQKLVQSFIKYEISRLDVDIEGNAFVYVKDVETIALARFVNDSKFLNRHNEEWENIKGNWYKQKQTRKVPNNEKIAPDSIVIKYTDFNDATCHILGIHYWDFEDIFADNLYSLKLTDKKKIKRLMHK